MPVSWLRGFWTPWSAGFATRDAAAKASSACARDPVQHHTMAHIFFK